MAGVHFFLFLFLAFSAVVNSEPFNKNISRNILVMSINKDTGDLYAASVNLLFRMNSQMRYLEMVAIGPVLDHPDCFPPPYPCEHNRTMTDFIPSSLTLLYQQQPKLMLCGDAYRGLCRIHRLENLTNSIWIQPYNQSLGLTANGKISLFFHRSEDGGDVLFSATDYTPDRKDELAPAFVSQKDLVERNGKFIFERRSHQGAIHFKDNVQRTVILTFLDDGFWFVLFVQDDGQKKQTRLARMCTSDPTMATYTEISLYSAFTANVSGESEKVEIATIAYYDADPEQTALYVYFMSEVHRSRGMAVFQMQEVHSYMKRARIDCLSSGSYTRLLDPITGKFSPCNRHSTNASDVNLCLYGDLNPFVSSHGNDMEGFFLLESPRGDVTALAVYRRFGDTFVMTGLDGFGILQVKILPNGRASTTRLAAQRRMNKIPFVALDEKKQKAYFLTDETIVMLWTDKCYQYETCLACSRHENRNCSWCDGLCHSSEVCSKMNSNTTTGCPPTILQIQPRQGLLMGGTHLTIEGENFGITRFDAKPSVTVAGIECEVIRWEYDMVDCLTELVPPAVRSPRSRYHSGPVQLKIRGFSVISPVNFTYVEARLYGIYPGKGPKSGGTNVTFFGDYLNVGQLAKLNVMGRKCNPILIKKNSISCTVGGGPERFYYRNIEVKFYRTNLVIIRYPDDPTFEPPLSTEFEFRPDPQIHGLYPRESTLGTPMNITVSGLDLDIIQEPRMVMYVPSIQGGEMELQELCWLNPGSNGTTMTCSLPDLIQGKVMIPQGSEPLVTHIAFIMDGVEELRNFHKHHERASRFLYFRDPEFETFDETTEVNQVLVIKGKYLNLVYSSNDTCVTLGNGIPCNVSFLTADELQCILPPEVTANSSLLEQHLQVKVVTGTSLEHYLGYVVMREKKTGENWIIVVSVTLVIVLSLVASFTCYYKKRGWKILSSKKAIMDKTDSLLSPLASVEERLSSPFVDKETVQLLRDSNLLIAKEHLTIGTKVGLGQFGCVNEGNLDIPGNGFKGKVAVKSIKYVHDLTKESIVEFLNEGLLMKNFCHEHVLSLIGVSFNNDMPVVIVPFMDNGDLRSYVREEDNVLTVADLFKFSYQLASGMAYLAAKSFIHRDVAARNCVLDSNLSVKVADFGLSRNVHDKKYYRSDNRKKKLPVKWMAPECLQNLTFSEKTDVWSYAVTLWEILTRGVTPYPTVDNPELLEYLRCGHRLPMPEYCSRELYDAMLECWQFDSRMRPSFKDLETTVHRMWEECSVDSQKTSALNTAYLTSSIHQSEAVHEDLVLDPLIQV